VALDVTGRTRPLPAHFRLKAGWLGLKRLRRYDLYAPLAPSDQDVRYPTPVRSVLQTFADFHPRFRDTRRAGGSAETHLDSENPQGEAGRRLLLHVLPRFTPWVHVQTSPGRVRDVATLAHELGHAVHSMLAEPIRSSRRALFAPLAETASVFGEMLMTDRLLRDEKNPLNPSRAARLGGGRRLRTCCARPISSFFEREAHRAVLADARSTRSAICTWRSSANSSATAWRSRPSFRYEC